MSRSLAVVLVCCLAAAAAPAAQAIPPNDVCVNPPSVTTGPCGDPRWPAYCDVVTCEAIVDLCVVVPPGSGQTTVCVQVWVPKTSDHVPEPDVETTLPGCAGPVDHVPPKYAARLPQALGC